MANCERCGKHVEGCGIPDFIVCETEPSVLYCSGYAMYEVRLCRECGEALRKFMKMEENKNGLAE